MNPSGLQSPPSVLITGASRGLGAEFVRQYAAAGWRVFAAMRNPAPVPEGAIALALDVADEAAHAATLQFLMSHPPGIDVLIHNAAIFAEGEGSLRTIDADAMLRVLRVNLLAPLLLTRALLPVLRPHAKILALTSGAGVMRCGGDPPSGQYSYGISKAALHHALWRMSAELAPEGFIVSGIAPGFVLTDMTRSSPAPPPLLPPESVAGMIARIEALKPGDSGKFFAWDGVECAWFPEG